VCSSDLAGGPTEEDLKKGEEFGARFAEVIKARGRGPQEVTS